jgi:hypothetical protein
MLHQPKPLPFPPIATSSQICSSFGSILQPWQKEGLQFLWRNLVDMYKPQVGPGPAAPVTAWSASAAGRARRTQLFAAAAAAAAATAAAGTLCQAAGGIGASWRISQPCDTAAPCPLQLEDVDEGGCILAHSMGLGKTLQTIAFLHTFFRYHKVNRAAVGVVGLGAACCFHLAAGETGTALALVLLAAPRQAAGQGALQTVLCSPAAEPPPPLQEEGQRALLVVPASVLHNWHDELKRWLPGAGTPGSAASALVLSKVHVLEAGKGLEPLRRWHSQSGSALVMTYDMVTQLVMGGKKKGRPAKRPSDEQQQQQQQQQQQRPAGQGQLEREGSSEAGARRLFFFAAPACSSDCVQQLLPACPTAAGMPRCRAGLRAPVIPALS